jgi:hypothetical protein
VAFDAFLVAAKASIAAEAARTEAQSWVFAATQSAVWQQSGATPTLPPSRTAGASPRRSRDATKAALQAALAAAAAAISASAQAMLAASPQALPPTPPAPLRCVNRMIVAAGATPHLFRNDGATPAALSTAKVQGQLRDSATPATAHVWRHQYQARRVRTARTRACCSIRAPS